MKNNKGFTLVELIGVIILLSLLTVLIVPNVLRIVEQNRLSSFEESVKGLIRSVQEHYASTDEAFPEEGLDVTNLGFSVENIENFISGLIFEENGTYSVSNLTDGNYYANGKRNSLTITGFVPYEVDVIDFSDFTNWRSGQYSLSTGRWEGYASRLALNDYITCKPGATYKVNVSDGSYRLIIRLMDKDKKFVKSIGAVANNTTFQTTDTTAYLAVSLYAPTIYSLTYAGYQQVFDSGLTITVKEQK